jgi:putative inorganic carbon (HCO3(-)) transporter
MTAYSTAPPSRLPRALIFGVFLLGYACMVLKFTQLSETWLLLIIAALGAVIFLLMLRDWHLLFVGALAFCLPLLYIDANLYYDRGDAGIAFSAVELAMLALWLESILTIPREERKKAAPSVIRWLIPALLLAALISLQAAVKPNLALFELIRLIKMALLCWLVAGAINSKAALRTMIVALFITAILQSGVGVAQKITGGALASDLIGEKDPIMTVELDTGESFTRVGGTLGHPNEFARFLSLILPLALISIIGETEKKFRWLAAFTFAFGSLALLLTLTRGAWFGMIGATALVFLMALRHPALRARAWRSLKFLLLLLVPLLLINLGTLKSRFTSDDKGSLDTRLPMARVALKMIAANPWLGVGIGNYREWLPSYGDPDNPFTLKQKVHNLYLLLAAEMGISALLIFLGILVVALGTCWKLAREAPLQSALAVIGIAGGLLAFAIHSMVDYVELGRLPILWCCLGMLLAIKTQSQKEAL